MSPTLAPIHLPPVTFLMSDHATSTLAVDVAQKLSDTNATLYVDDFLAPIYEGLQSMFSIDWKRDMGDSKDTNRLMLEAADGESSEGDIIVSLEKWFNETFGEAQLGKMGLQRMKVNRDMFDYPYLFRDATPVHMQPFLADDSIPRRDILMVDLSGSRHRIVGSVFNVTTIAWDTIPTLDQALAAIEGACR